MVHPMVIAPIFVAVFVILAIVFSRGKKEKETLETPKHHRQESTTSSSEAESAPAASSGGKKKKRRSKKKSTKSESEKEGAESEEETEAESPKPAAPAKVETKTAAAAAPAAKSAPVTIPAPAVVADEDDSSSSDEDEAPKPKKAAKKAATAVVKKSAADELAPTTTVVASSSHFDGWAVVEDKKGKAKLQKKAEAAAIAAAAAAAAAEAESAKKKSSKVVEPEPASPVEEEPVSPPPIVDLITHEMTVDSKKVGLLIGPKGVTKIGIQNATATNIQMPKTDKDATGPVTISVSGPELGVKKAVQALNELLTKGYCALLAPEDFQESYVAVHPKYLKDIIGNKGSVIRALSAHTNVKITIPDNIKAPGPDGKVTKVKIGLTGQREKVSLARALIKDLTKYYHTTVTHPGLVHTELSIPANYYNYIIGAKGSEIKNIQGTHKVTVYIPDADSANPNVVVVGEPQNVIAAQNHIEKLIIRADERAAAAAAAAEAAAPAVSPKPVSTPTTPATVGGNVIGATVGGGPGWNTTNVRKPKDEDDEPEESWVKDYAPTGGFSLNISSIIGENTKFAPVSVQPAVVPVAGVTMPTPIEKPLGPAPSSAWNNLSSAWNN